MTIKRGNIHWANLHEPDGSTIICKPRPVIVVSNDDANYCSSIIHVVPLTSRKKRKLPTHVKISGYGLPCISTALVEQVKCIDKVALGNKIGTLANTEELQKINKCLGVQLGFAS